MGKAGHLLQRQRTLRRYEFRFNSIQSKMQRERKYNGGEERYNYLSNVGHFVSLSLAYITIQMIN